MMLVVVYSHYSQAKCCKRSEVVQFWWFSFRLCLESKKRKGKKKNKEAKNEWENLLLRIY